ncbi:ParA family protein, partial [Acinetobacter baumannii]
SSLFKDGPLPTLKAAEAGIYVIRADAAMADVERLPNSAIAAFKKHVSGFDSFDFCVIDTAPTMGVRMSSALIAADYVLAPIELENYSLDGITKMLQ